MREVEPVVYGDGEVFTYHSTQSERRLSRRQPSFDGRRQTEHVPPSTGDRLSHLEALVERLESQVLALSEAVEVLIRRTAPAARQRQVAPEAGPVARKGRAESQEAAHSSRRRPPARSAPEGPAGTEDPDVKVTLFAEGTATASVGQPRVFLE